MSLLVFTVSIAKPLLRAGIDLGGYLQGLSQVLVTVIVGF
ncbi:hypothetical protein TRP8649_04751 [Pelagimonas phthalicica]|uniref:Uncharacterized protein n=1 Tax=Pelagimonas phthalicica TaxID=1037362 RepID=A0A238JK97_9RHOB|nr:hypothetical protein CLV87_4840 [Pelagimonas phthalicica]SMX30607.1 hypothetical protein TRP8649_04751 [Pelagimonas phthalicica]